ncbi:MAG: trypsin-like peptidase domain-containing protein [Lachnospiraceae bacterium]|nr:trypsin-like peptidase domain-containing protein [Lachnospiraceae bacterium]
MNGYDENNIGGMNEMNKNQQSFISPEDLQAQIDSEKRMQEEVAKAETSQTAADMTDAQAITQPNVTTYTQASEQPFAQQTYTQQRETTYTHTNEQGYAQQTYTQQSTQETVTGKAKKAKKERKPMPAIGKFALSGAVFGLCGALVFSGVMVIGNHTFLKKDSSIETMDSDEDSMAERKEDRKEESEGSSVDDSFVKKNEKEEEAEIGEGKTLPTTNTKDAATISEITKSVMPSIVSITVKGVEEVQSMFGTQKYEAEGAGSGIVVSETDDSLLIATNNHVVSGANEVSVCFNDSEDAVVAAEVKGTDVKNDLAIVAVKKEDIDKEVLKEIKVITIGSSDELHVGDQVIAIGNALGYGQSVTTGIVSALNREVEIENMAAKLIQTDAAINPGNSGGALLNMNGELIGINSAKFASNTIEGMGYAIPIDTAKPILDKLMNRASKEEVSDEDAGYLGVTIQDVSEEAAKNYGIPEGAYIVSVEEGGGAEKAGLQKGDVITKFDGIGISGAADLKEQIKYYKKGDTVEVTFQRMTDGGYEEKTAEITLAESEAAAKRKQLEKENEEAMNGYPEMDGQDEVDENDGQELPEIPNRNEDRAKEYGYDDGNGGNGNYGYGSEEDLQEFFDRFFGQAEEYGYGYGPQRGY